MDTTNPYKPATVASVLEKMAGVMEKHHAVIHESRATAIAEAERRVAALPQPVRPEGEPSGDGTGTGDTPG